QVSLGQRALERGWISDDALRHCIERVEEDPSLTVHELWVESGFLTAEQVSALVLSSDALVADDESSETLHHDNTLVHRKNKSAPNFLPPTGNTGPLPVVEMGGP